MSAREWYECEPDEKSVSFTGEVLYYRYEDKWYSREVIHELRDKRRLREAFDGIREDMFGRYTDAMHGVASRLHKVLKRNGAL